MANKQYQDQGSGKLLKLEKSGLRMKKEGK